MKNLLKVLGLIGICAGIGALVYELTANRDIVDDDIDNIDFDEYDDDFYDDDDLYEDEDVFRERVKELKEIEDDFDKHFDYDKDKCEALEDSKYIKIN